MKLLWTASVPRGQRMCLQRICERHCDLDHGNFWSVKTTYRKKENFDSNQIFLGWPRLSRNFQLILLILAVSSSKNGFSLFLPFFTPKTNAEITGTNAEIRGTNAEIPGMDFRLIFVHFSAIQIENSSVWILAQGLHSEHEHQEFFV